MDEESPKHVDFETICPRMKAVEVADKTLLVGPVVLRVWKQASEVGVRIVERLAAAYPNADVGQASPIMVVTAAFEEVPDLLALIVKEKTEDGCAIAVDREWLLDNLDARAALDLIEALMDANEWEHLVGKYAALVAKVQAARAGASASTS